MPINMELKSSTFLDLDRILLPIEKIMLKYKRPPLGVYVKSMRLPFTHEDGLFVHQTGKELDLTATLPYGAGVDIVNKRGDLLIPAYILDNKPDTVSVYPFNPILVMDYLVDILDYMQNEFNPQSNLLYRNDLTNVETPMIGSYIKGIGNIEDVIELDYPNMIIEDQNKINELLHRFIVPVFASILEDDTTAFYELVFNNLNIELRKYDDIRSIRYLEAIELKNLQEEIECM